MRARKEIPKKSAPPRELAGPNWSDTDFVAGAALPQSATDLVAGARSYADR